MSKNKKAPQVRPVNPELARHSFDNFKTQIQKIQASLANTHDNKQVKQLLSDLKRLIQTHKEALTPLDTGAEVTKDKSIKTAPYKHDILCINFRYKINQGEESVVQLFFHDEKLVEHKFLKHTAQQNELNELMSISAIKTLLIDPDTICETKNLRLDQQKTLSSSKSVELAIQKNKAEGKIKEKNSGTKAGDTLSTLECSETTILSEIFSPEKKSCAQIKKCTQDHAHLVIKDYPPTGSFEFRYFSDVVNIFPENDVVNIIGENPGASNPFNAHGDTHATTYT